jgi:hypothetical protein
MLALTGHRGHFSIGAPGLDLVDATREMAARLAHLGFGPAAPTSFGRPLTWDRPEPVGALHLPAGRSEWAS